MLSQRVSELSSQLEARSSTCEEQIEIIQLECTKLRSTLDSSQKTSMDAGRTVSGLKEQLQALKETNAELEDNIFRASFETLEADRLTKENTFLRNERDYLRGELGSQSDRLAASDITSVEKEALLARINELEEELKAENLNELRDELTSLHEERQHLDLDNEELLVQLGLMQQEKTENETDCEAEVQTLREQMSTLRDQCKHLQNELDKLRSCQTVLGENGQVNHLTEGISSPHQILSQLRGENDSLKDKINNLTKKHKGVALENSQKMETLRQTLGLLEVKLAEKEEEVELAKENVKSSKEEMRNAVDAKDGEISKLKSQHSSREDEMKDMSSKLDIANNEMSSFNSQLECLQSKQDQVKYNQSFGGDKKEEVYEYDDDISLQDLLAEAVLDSDDYLRSQIIVLAQALEKAELQRADVLERMFTERKSNEDSLRQLGESLKRFYSTVRCSDAP